MTVYLFAYTHYKRYVIDKLNALDGSPKRGAQSRLSQAIGCQTAYVTQVLKKNAHFSLEQAEAINQFFEHNDDEAQYFLLLIQFERASTKPLKQRLKKLIDQSLDKRRSTLFEKLDLRSDLTHDQQIRYCSSWLYGAIHMGCTIKALNNEVALSKYFDVNLQIIKEILKFLCECGLISLSTQGIITPLKEFHTNRKPEITMRHLLNWRLQAIRKIEQGNSQNFHTASVLSISKEDRDKVLSKLMSFYTELKEIVKQSETEELVCLNMDLFGI